ncbi:hypothetical protein NKH73_24545 [Mesorhizobium sp. M0938]|uniref:hypothetical protein n=1 Tax=unclassified Mesorhizobium TaxID=325217 RepID=UPI00333DA78E
MTDRLAHHSFSLKRQQIIKPRRAQLDRAAWNAIGTVFNTFWPLLATSFSDLYRVVLPFQGDLPSWNHQSEPFQHAVRSWRKHDAGASNPKWGRFAKIRVQKKARAAVRIDSSAAQELDASKTSC